MQAASFQEPKAFPQEPNVASLATLTPLASFAREAEFSLPASAVELRGRGALPRTGVSLASQRARGALFFPPRFLRRGATSAPESGEAPGRREARQTRAARLHLHLHPHLPDFSLSEGADAAGRGRRGRREAGGRRLRTVYSRTWLWKFCSRMVTSSASILPQPPQAMAAAPGPPACQTASGRGTMAGGSACCLLSRGGRRGGPGPGPTTITTKTASASPPRSPGSCHTALRLKGAGPPGPASR